MAGWRRLVHGDLADPLTRLHERRAARLLGRRLSAVERPLRAVLQLYRLARHAVARRPASALGVLRPQTRQGTADLGRKPPPAAGRAARDEGAADRHLQ